VGLCGWLAICLSPTASQADWILVWGSLVVPGTDCISDIGRGLHFNPRPSEWLSIGHVTQT
jgi:hypothetical protein